MDQMLVLGDTTNHMTALDWAVAAVWVLGTSLFGTWFVRRVKTAKDYLVAGRKLKWWQIGLAQAADSVDANDFIAIAGLGYVSGLTGLGYVWFSMAVGTYILARHLAPMLYRTGVVTNAEFIALRFNPPMRIASAFIQVLYRFIALALCAHAMAVMFRVVIGVDMNAGIVIAMCITILYVFASGQLGVVMAAVPQVFLMLIVAGIIFFSVFADIGGLGGFNENKAVYGDMLSLTYHNDDEARQAGIPNVVYLIGLILGLFSYPLVNQTVAQRIVSADSESDARKGSIVSLLPWFIVTGVAIMAGIIGTKLVPVTQLPLKANGTPNYDMLYPMYMVEYLTQWKGLLGLGVAALVVGSMSTGAGIGTAISGLMTNDVFKVINSERYTERQKLWWTRLFATAAIVFGSLLSTLVGKFDGMVKFYVVFSGTFVLPLAVPYLAAAFCPWASRWSALASLVGGCGLGLVLFLPTLPEPFPKPYDLPVWMSHAQVRPFWVLGFAVLVLILWSLVENARRGRTPRSELAGQLNLFDLGNSRMTPEQVRAVMEGDRLGHWPAKQNVEYDKVGVRADCPWYARPGLYEVLTLVAIVILVIWLR